MFGSPITGQQPVPPGSLQGPPSPPLVPPVAPFSGHGRPSIEGDTNTSLSRSEQAYIRERDRSLSVSKSPVTSDNGHQQQPMSPTQEAHLQSPTPQLSPPPPIVNLRSPSPGYSSLSVSPQYKTPSEFPLPPGPGSFYNLPGVSGSGPLTPGGARTISAAAFKRIRGPSSPPPSEGRQGTGEVGPLVVNKRGIPGSPRLSPRIQPGDSTEIQRMSSAPEPGNLYDPRSRPPMTMQPPSFRGSEVRPDSMVRSSGEGYGEDDEYDYISAYVDEMSGLSPISHGGEQRRVSQAGYGQGQFATNLDNDSIR